MSKKAAFGLSADATRLAEVVSFAARVDPTLLREARLRLLPELDAGVEADVWLCPAVEASDRRGFLFSPEAGSALRERLWLRGRKQYDDAWELTKDLHAHLPAAEQAEEKLQYLELLSDDARNPEESSKAQARAQIQELLRSVIASMVAGPQSGLAHWAARLLARHGKWLPQQSDAPMLADAAHLRLDGVMRRSEDHEKLPAWLSWVAPKDFPRERIAVRLREGQLEAGSPEELATDATERDALAILEVPRTAPLVLEAVEGSTVRRLELRRNEQKRWGMQRVEVAHADRVLLRTIFGERFELESQPSVDARLRGEIVDFTELMDLHRPFVGKNPYLERTTVGRQWNLITGSAGTGKSAICVNIIDSFSSGPGCVAYHFFRRDMPHGRSVDIAMRSLAAQIERAFPQFEGSEDTAEGRLLGVLTRYAESGERLKLGPLLIVLDGCETPGEEALEPIFRCPLGALAVGVASFSSRSELASDRYFHPVDLDTRESITIRENAIRETLGGDALRNGESIPSWTWAKLQSELRPLGFDAMLPADLTEAFRAALAFLARIGGPEIADVVQRLIAERELVPQSILFQEFLGEDGPIAQNAIPQSGQGSLARFGEVRRVLRPFIVDLGGRIGIRSEELRAAGRQAIGEYALLRAHAEVIREGGAASWPTSAERDSERWTYAVRNALFHAWEAGDRERAERLLRDVSYIESRAQEQGLRFLGDIANTGNQLQLLPGKAFELDEMLQSLQHESNSVSEVLFALNAQLDRSESLILSKYDFPPGRPLLRPWKTVEIGPASNQPLVLSDVVGGRLSADGIAALWAEDGRMFFLHPEEGAEDLLSGTPRVVTAFAGTKGIVAARFLPEKLLAVAGGDGSLSVVDAESGAVVLRRAASTVALRGIEVTEPHERPNASLREERFYVVTWDAKNELRVWDFAGFDPRADHSGLFATHHALDVPQGIVCVKMTPGGASLLIGREDGVVLELNLDDSSLALAFRGKAAVTDLQIDATEKRVVAGFADGTVGDWTLDGFHPRGHALACDLAVRSIALLEEDGVAVLGLDGRVRFPGSEVVETRWNSKFPHARIVQLARAGAEFMVACDDGVLRSAFLSSNGVMARDVVSHSDSIGAMHANASLALCITEDHLAFVATSAIKQVPSADARRISGAEWALSPPRVRWLSSRAAKKYSLLALQGGGLAASLPGNAYRLLSSQSESGSTYELPPAYRGVASSAGGEVQIATSDGFGLLVLRFVKEGEPPKQETIWYGEPLYDQAASSDGRMIVALSSMNRLLVSDLERRGRFEFDLGATGPIGPGDRCAVSDALAAAVVRRNGSLVVYDLTERRDIARIELPARAISCEFETPDRLRVTFDSGAIEVFSSPTLEVQGKVAAGSRVTAVVPGDPSTGFVVCRSDGAILLVGRGQSEDWSVAAHRQAVTAAVRFAHDRALATASLDGWIKLWRESDGTLLAALPLHAPILAMVESAGRLVARTADGKLHFVRRPCVVLSHEVVEATVSLAVRLVEQLAERGIDVRERYTSRRMEDEAEAMDREMEEAIEAADVLVPFLVPAQMRETRYVEREVDQALRRRESRAPLSIVPVVVGREGVTEELESVRPWRMLRDDTAVFVDYGGNPERDIQAALDTILRAVSSPPRGINPRDDDRPQAMAEQNLA